MQSASDNAVVCNSTEEEEEDESLACTKLRATVHACLLQGLSDMIIYHTCLNQCYRHILWYTLTTLETVFVIKRCNSRYNQLNT